MFMRLFKILYSIQLFCYENASAFVKFLLPGSAPYSQLEILYFFNKLFYLIQKSFLGKVERVFSDYLRIESGFL